MDPMPLFEVPIWWSALVVPLAARIHRVPAGQRMGLTARCKTAPPSAVSVGKAQRNTPVEEGSCVEDSAIGCGFGGLVSRRAPTIWASAARWQGNALDETIGGPPGVRTGTPLSWRSGKPSVSSSIQTRMTTHTKTGDTKKCLWKLYKTSINSHLSNSSSVSCITGLVLA